MLFKTPWSSGQANQWSAWQSSSQANQWSAWQSLSQVLRHIQHHSWWQREQIMCMQPPGGQGGQVKHKEKKLFTYGYPADPIKW